MHPHSLADKAGKICWRNIQNILIFKNIICVFPSQNIMYSLWKAPNKQNIENQDHIPSCWVSGGSGRLEGEGLAPQNS